MHSGVAGDEVPEKPQSERLFICRLTLEWWAGGLGRTPVIIIESPGMGEAVQRFGIKPWSRLIGELTQNLGVGLAWLDLRNTELQLQAKVMEACGWR